jgi:hypothetical protein
MTNDIEPDSVFGIDLDEPVEYWTEIHLGAEPEAESGSDPEAVVDGPGCSVRDLEAYEAAMDAALDEPEPECELEAG